MAELEHFEEIAEKLANAMVTKVLGEVLFYRASEYFEVLDSKYSTYEEKHKACVLAEKLLSDTRDFPEIVKPTNRGRR